jgi:cytochrome c-type biogenesis protein CcmH/NrfF
MGFNVDEYFKYRNNDNPKCPHCDEDIDISENELYHLYEDGTHEIDCPNCNGNIIVESDAKWSFSTDVE